MKIESMADLRAEYCAKHPDGHFFDADKLKFFGERFSEMRLFKKTTVVTDALGKQHTCYVVSSVQRPIMGNPFRMYHYFDTETLEII